MSRDRTRLKAERVAKIRSGICTVTSCSNRNNGTIYCAEHAHKIKLRRIELNKKHTSVKLNLKRNYK